MKLKKDSVERRLHDMFVIMREHGRGFDSHTLAHHIDMLTDEEAERAVLVWGTGIIKFESLLKTLHETGLSIRKETCECCGFDYFVLVETDESKHRTIKRHWRI